jgi:hypothetical protein
MNRRIDAAAEEAGRDPAEIRRLYNIAGRFGRSGTGFLQGSADMWAEQLVELVIEQRFSGFIVMGDDPDLLRQFAGDVVPAVRDRLEQEHVVIHGVLEQVDRALVAFASGSEGDKQPCAAADLLADTLLSHLAYEERELVEPLARLGFY